MTRRKIPINTHSTTQGQCTVPFLGGLGYGLRLHTTMQLPTKPELNSPGSRLCVSREPGRRQGPAHKTTH